MNQSETPEDDVVQAELADKVESVRRTPWGFWTTFGFSLAVIVAFIAIEAIVVIGLVIFQTGRNIQASPAILEQVASSGLALAVGEWVGAPLCLAMVILFAKLRKQWSVRDYLALHSVSTKTYFAWAMILLGYVGAADATSWLIGRGVTSEVMRNAYRTAGFLPLLWTALVVAAPVFEEALFRGFMFRGIQGSPVGTAGAIVLTSLIWSGMHIQYDVFEIAVIFLGGILLGIARARHNSIGLTIALHSLMNLVAIAELESCVRGW